MHTLAETLSLWRRDFTRLLLMEHTACQQMITLQLKLKIHLVHLRLQSKRNCQKGRYVDVTTIYLHLLITYMHSTFFFQQCHTADKVRQKVRISLKCLESLSFNMTDPAMLESLLSQLQSLEAQYKAQLPASEGLTIRPKLIHTAAKLKRKYKRLQKRLQHYSALPSHSRSKRPSEYKFKGRVGIAADRLRKVCIPTSILCCILSHNCELTFIRSFYRANARKLRKCMTNFKPKKVRVIYCMCICWMLLSTNSLKFFTHKVL